MSSEPSSGAAAAPENGGQALAFDQIFGPAGEIARSHPNYEYRPGQARMAEAVARALAERHHLCVEAGTGTGKTLAYLIPTIFSGKRVIVSTGTKNLQEQLFFKDVPFIEQAFGRKLSVSYMKGRSNYLCIRKLAELDEEETLFPGHRGYLSAIRDWARHTETGDRAELKELPEDLSLWHQIDGRRETCTGQKCPDFEACFVTRVRKRALESDIVIVNHHLFFADLALKQGDFGSVLPEYSAVIFDEAHELEDVATQYFGLMVSNYRFEELVRDADHALQEAEAHSPFLQGQLARLSTRALEFFAPFQSPEGRFSFRELGAGYPIRRVPEQSDRVADTYRALLTQLSVAASALAALEVQTEKIEAIVRRASELNAELATILESESRENVYWYEARGRGAFLWATPICISSILGERLFDRVDSVVLTSATLSTGDNFQFIRSRLGLERSEELILGSHFDFSRQALLYIPLHLPEPRDPGWVSQACEVLIKILEASQGRAFVLFTSYAQMQTVYRVLKGRLRYPMFLQGTKSKIGLLEDFRKTPNAVLFATSSFWQGVDVQGDQLSCVVIDKLPFSVPSDPVTAARIRHLDESGGNAFYDYQIPEAVILLKQGLGRLIRSRTDRGILALLDRRILTKSYGKVFLQSFPPAPVTHDTERLREFFLEG